MNKKFIIFGIIIIVALLTFVAMNSEKMTEEDQSTYLQTASISKQYENAINNDLANVLEKIPSYAPSQHQVCKHKNGYIIEDAHSAEWYVEGDNIYNVNGLAASLTPSLEYATSAIPYAACFK